MKNIVKKYINFKVIAVKQFKSRAVIVIYNLSEVKTQLKITLMITQIFKINIRVRKQKYIIIIKRVCINIIQINLLKKIIQVIYNINLTL